MNKVITMLIVSIIVFSTNMSISYCEGKNRMKVNDFDIKLSIKGKEEYKGMVIGKLNLIEIQIKNNEEKKYRIGNYFRVLMTSGQNEWSQFSMAASGQTSLNSDSLSSLKYGYGSNAIVKRGEDKNSIMIHMGNMNSTVIAEGINNVTTGFEKWWPEYLLPKSSVTIKWPTFWFSDSVDTPQFIAIPSLSSKDEQYFYWVNFNNNDSREIVVNSKNFLKIISDTTEPVGLRAVSVAWLLECDRKNEKHLLPYLINKHTPEALAYRSMQALMIWGSPEIIDDIFLLWKERKLLPFLDKDMKYYFTWSSHQNAMEATKEVKAGNR